MLCRDQAKGDAAKKEIETATGSKLVELLTGDLSSLESVRSIAKNYLEKHDKLHVLVNNAWIDNWETFA